MSLSGRGERAHSCRSPFAPVGVRFAAPLRASLMIWRLMDFHFAWRRALLASEMMTHAGKTTSSPIAKPISVYAIKCDIMSPRVFLLVP